MTRIDINGTKTGGLQYEKPPVLIRGVNWVGDSVMTLPAIKAIKNTNPQSAVVMLCKPNTQAIYQNNPFIDEIIPLDIRFSGIVGRLRLYEMLRSYGFVHAILLQNAFGAALTAKLSGIPKITGYNRDFRGFLLTEKKPYNKDDRKAHHIDYFLNLLGKFAETIAHSDPWIYLTTDERLKARNALSALKRPIIGLNPGAAYGSAKQWPSNRFSEIANMIIDKLNGSIVLFGHGSESIIANEILNGIEDKERLLNLADKTTLRELISLISECDAVITNDSGPMHIAYAVKTPLVVIFGSTSPKLTGPPERAAYKVIYKNSPCSPCFKRECPMQSIPCMSEITAHEVFDALSDLIPQNKAIFFDRDGTLNIDKGYLNNWNDFKELDDISSINKLFLNGFMLIGATNQSGIARGIIKEEFVKDVSRHFIEKFGFTDFYYCPHHPDEHCECRKPSPAMLYKARSEYRVDIRKSYVVGDTDKDMLLAVNSGAKPVLVKTGELKHSANARYEADTMKDAVEWIIKDSIH